MISRLTWTAIAVWTVAAIALYSWSDVPLGVPGEWVWYRIELGDDAGIELLLGAVTALIGFVPLALVAGIGLTHVPGTSRRVRACWVLSLCAAAFVWLWAVQEAAPSGHRLSKGPFVLFYEGSSGYFTKARYETDDLAEFLAGYEELMAEGDVLHVGTHPPGLFVLYRGLWRACSESETLTRFVLATMPASAEEAVTSIRQGQRRTTRPLSDADAATLWLAVLLTQLAAVSTVIPLYLIVRLDFDRRLSWAAASLWPLIPAVAVFLPKSDALYPALAVWFLYLWRSGLRRGSAVRTAGAGLVLWAGLFLSLALLPVALVALLLLAIPWGRSNDSGPSWGRTIAHVAAAGAAFFLACGLLWVFCDVNLPSVWLANLRNHAGFYDAYPRTYWKWLGVNAVEVFCAVGPPLGVLVVASGFAAVKRSGGEVPRVWLATVAVFALLWLSGKNMGEAARLWLVLMPGACWLAAVTMAGKEDEGRLSTRRFLLLFSLQAFVSAATVMRISGFVHEGLLQR